MKTIRAYRQHLLVLVTGLSLLTAAVVVAQRQASPQAPFARNAQELSEGFRRVAAEVTPSVVTILTVGKPMRVQGENPFGNNELFREFFRNDPRFRDFFEQPEGNGEGRELPAPRGRGSGFIIDRSGVIVTNSHVVRNAESVKVRLSDGREFPAEEIKADPRSDLAVIRIKVPADVSLKPLRLGDSSAMQVGDWVLAVGSPFGYDLSVTAGIISGKGRGPRINQREDYLQTDAAINPGNSGGPLVDLQGNVVGVNTAISTRSGGYDGIGFAVPVNMARWVIDQLLEKGEVTRAYLGIKMQEVDNALARALNVPIGQGVIVAEVLPETPAAEAEIKTGDIILELNGQEVTSPRRLQAIVERLTIGETYKMTVLRDGRRVKLTIAARSMPEDFSLLATPTPRQNLPDEPEQESFEDIGLEVSELTDALRKQLELEEVQGVLVSSVEVNSPAYRAGIRTGEIIEKVGSTEITGPEDFRKTIEEASLEDGILVVVRGRTGTRITVIEAQ